MSPRQPKSDNGNGHLGSLPENEATRGKSPFVRWPLLVLAFGTLIVLMIVSGLATARKSAELYRSLSDLNDAYGRSWRSLNAIRSGIHVSSVLIRDYLVDPSQLRSREIREELLGMRKQAEANLTALEGVLDASRRDKAKELRTEINSYWESLDPVFEWEPRYKQAVGYYFLRHRILPQREVALELAEQVQELTESTFNEQKVKAGQREQEFRSFISSTITASVALGILVAIISVARVAILERRSYRQRQLTERAEDEMRRLSHQLVYAQEEERRAISRELHDEVSQMLTGLRMDLRTLKRLNGTSQQEFEDRVDQSCRLLEQTLQAVRDMAMGLRPSMLDDVGLEAALRWQAREFERRHDINVSLTVSGDLASLGERQRTNLYRIVQEGLTNCARHAKAKSVSIQLVSRPEGLTLRIEDNGVGINVSSSGGLGLIGIQERVRELAGTFHVAGEPGRGTRLEIDLPHQEVTANA